MKNPEKAIHCPSTMQISNYEFGDENVPVETIYLASDQKTKQYFLIMTSRDSYGEKAGVEEVFSCEETRDTELISLYDEFYSLYLRQIELEERAGVIVDNWLTAMH